MQRSYSLRCRCFVTPGAVSSCKAIVEQEICTVWNVLGSPFKQFKALIPRGSVTMLHFRSVYCFSSPLFCLFICCLQPSSPGSLLFYFYFRCLPFSLESFLQCQGTGVNFEQNVVLTKQDRSVGRISGFVRIAIPGMHLAFGLNFLLP